MSNSIPILDTIINQDNFFILVKFAIVFAIIIHIILLVLIIRQISSADKLGTRLTHKLIELMGYINIILSIIILTLLILP